MIERGHRETRPFGTRRAEERPEAWSREPAQDAPPAIPGWDAPRSPPGPLAWALRTAAVAGLAALFATQYLARLSGPGEVAAMRVAQGGRMLQADPETTGSIGRPAPAATPAGAARATRLDPCALAAPARPLP